MKTSPHSTGLRFWKRTNYERQRGRRSFERRVSRNTARGGRRKHKFVVDLERGKLYHRGINRRNCVFKVMEITARALAERERRSLLAAGADTRGDDWDLIHTHAMLHTPIGCLVWSHLVQMRAWVPPISAPSSLFSHSTLSRRPALDSANVSSWPRRRTQSFYPASCRVSARCLRLCTRTLICVYVPDAST